MSVCLPWSEICSRVATVPGAALPMRLEAVEGHLRVSTYAADITGLLPPGWHSRDYPLEPCETLDEQLEFALDCMERDAIHEVREAFGFWSCAGVERPFDPHRRRP